MDLKATKVMRVPRTKKPSVFTGRSSGTEKPLGIKEHLRQSWGPMGLQLRFKKAFLPLIRGSDFENWLAQALEIRGVRILCRLGDSFWGG